MAKQMKEKTENKKRQRNTINMKFFSDRVFVFFFEKKVKSSKRKLKRNKKHIFIFKFFF